MRDLPTFDPKDISRIVQHCYGIKVLSITPHRRVFRLETNLGTRFFKPFHLSEARLQLIVEAKAHLLFQGFREFCPFVAALDGTPYVRVGEQLYYMTPWIEGHPANYDSPFELRQSMLLFARFHQAAVNFDPPQEMFSYLGKWPAIFHKRQEEITECREQAQTMRQPTVVDECFLRTADFYLEEAEKAIAMLAETEYTVMCQEAAQLRPFCHHDPAHHNVLITRENTTILIDFDYLLQDLHLHDLASLVIRNGKSSNWNLKRAEYLLKSYSEVSEVSPSDLAVIRAFATFPHDIWLWAKARYIEKRSWSLAYYMKEWQRKTRHESERQRFLAGLTGMELE